MKLLQRKSNSSVFRFQTRISYCPEHLAQSEALEFKLTEILNQKSPRIFYLALEGSEFSHRLSIVFLNESYDENFWIESLHAQLKDFLAIKQDLFMDPLVCEPIKEANLAMAIRNQLEQRKQDQGPGF